MNNKELFNILLKKVEEYRDKNAYVSVTSNSDYSVFFKKYLKNKYNANSLVSDLNIYYFNKGTIIAIYKTTDFINPEERKNILIIKDEMPVIRFNYSETKNARTCYSSFASYIFDNNYLDGVFKINSITSGNLVKENVKINLHMCNGDKEVFKNGEIIYLDGRAISISNNGKNKLIVSDFDTRLLSLSSEKDKAIMFIKNVIDCSLGIDVVKEYKISHKNV